MRLSDATFACARLPAMRWRGWAVACVLFLVPVLTLAQAGGRSATREKVFIDTDIGDDVDDAFALGLALSSPELEVVGISGAWGDTELRARMLERFLKETGHSGIS